MDEDQKKKLLQDKQTELIKLIEALAKLDKSEEWNTLRELTFDKSVASIERQILSSSLSPEIDVNNLYKLQGEWAWAKQFTDIDRFVTTLKKQLEDIKNQLK